MLAGFLCAGARPALCKGEAERDLVQYANTLQGTNSEFRMTHGNTFPATTLPFGMHTWTPQTGVNGDGWKYQFERDSIRAFQQAHQCSSWTRDYMVYSLMPVCGELRVDQYGRAAKFSHDNETARPNYYSVAFENGIDMNLLDVCEYQRRNHYLPDAAGMIYFGDKEFSFSKITQIQMYTKTRYAGYTG